MCAGFTPLCIAIIDCVLIECIQCTQIKAIAQMSAVETLVWCRASTRWSVREVLQEVCLPLFVLAVGMFCSIAALSTLGDD